MQAPSVASKKQLPRTVSKIRVVVVCVIKALSRIGNKTIHWQRKPEMLNVQQIGPMNADLGLRASFPFVITGPF